MQPDLLCLCWPAQQHWLLEGVARRPTQPRNKTADRRESFVRDYTERHRKRENEASSAGCVAADLFVRKFSSKQKLLCHALATRYNFCE